MGSDRDQDDPKRWPDGVETWPADAAVQQSNAQARRQLAQFREPVLVDGPHDRLWIAAFDGTWNDKDKDTVDTNVAEIYDQVLNARKQGLRSIAAGYQSGVGTQDSWLEQKTDGAFGYSYGPRMEKMYLDFITQAEKWTKQDPNAQISVASIGFSRGGVTASMFTRMLHERGIQNPDGMVIDRDRDGNIRSLTPTQPALAPPGKTPQFLGLFDPVATGEMNLVDTRPAPSVVSGLQITAQHERRDLFLSKQIIDPGLSADGRFLAVQVGGAHSDIGGGYLLNGQSLRNGNLMMAALNGLSETPFLRERQVPTAPEMNVIHRSEQGASGYTTTMYDLHGKRHVTANLAGVKSVVVGNDNDAEPRNEAMNRGLRYQRVRVGPEREDPSLPAFFKDRPQQTQPPPSFNDWNQLLRNAPLSKTDDEARRQDPLLDALWAKLPPGTSHEKAEEVKLAAKVGGIERVGQFDRIDYKADDSRAFVMGTIPGFRAVVDLSSPAPPLAETRTNEEKHDREQALMWERFEQQQAQLNQDGPRMAMGGMKMRGPSMALPDFGQAGPAADGGGDDG